MTKETMLRNYRKISGADSYIVGFADKGAVYMVELKSIPPRYISYEAASRGQGHGLRLRLKKDWKAQLLKKAEKIGCVEDLVDETYNKGECFERLISNHYGIEWVKDHVPFTEGGDIKVSGKEIQIKFDGATFTTEKTLKRQMKIKKEVDKLNLL